ncbi:hypothetical protein F2Q70_00006412 [Brassica cretica]|uniref:CHCH domain-containing protein n=1 Tax=Brassica cretica TaxID=69181 RepID=A0A8S9IS86_BRACR|nr:hypothetical protein F2Q70_00006412 [Brassica cretica]
MAVTALLRSIRRRDVVSAPLSVYKSCVNNYGSEISKCQFYMDMLTECKKNSGSMMAA